MATLVEKEIESKLYELSYLISPDLSLEEVEGVLKNIKQLIEKHGGQTNQEHAPFRRTLAYPIHKKREGFFGYIRFSTDPSQIKEFKKTLQLSGNLMRFLLVTIDQNQLKDEQRQAHRLAPESVKKLYRPRKEKQQEIKSEEFEKKLGEILGE
ncbi:30S ribosomal protein S6 [Candidatus Parcubacteria bacterium]|nr:MAG: 30S ribosomal protein S6 [Candidatus Parcubacteria bacterium]